MKPEDFIITNENIRMPKLIYGTAWKQERTADLVEKAITAGFRGIDTACQPKHYHEPGVGTGLSTCINQKKLTRQELYLQTKFTPLDGQDPNRIPYDPHASLSEQVRQSCQTSLTNLQTIYLDCLVLHSPLPTQQLTFEVWQAMEKLVAEGAVKQLGISNCYDLKALENLYGTAYVKPAIIQNRFYAQTGYDRSIRAFCKEHGIIYQSFWTLTANPHILNDAVLMNIARHRKRSPAQVFFRYLSQIGIVPLTGTTSTTHVQEDLAIFEFELSTDDCAEIENAYQFNKN